jgi:hypothetical protein
MAVPATMSFIVWCGIIVVLKKFLVGKMYAPYALLMGGGLIYFVELSALAGITYESIDNEAYITTRLLIAIFSNKVPRYLFISFGLLFISLVVNYIINLVFIIIFCKCIRPLILRRQVDICSNYLTLLIGIITTYRVYLLSFSRLFPHPFINIS